MDRREQAAVTGGVSFTANKTTIRVFADCSAVVVADVDGTFDVADGGGNQTDEEKGSSTMYNGAESRNTEPGPVGSSDAGRQARLTRADDQPIGTMSFCQRISNEGS